MEQGWPTSFSKGPEPLLWASSRAAFVEINISGVHNILNYRKIFVLKVKVKFALEQATKAQRGVEV